MEEVAKLLNRMVKEEVILDYAVFGAIAQMRYTEAVVTFDADILVSVSNPEAIDILGPLYEFCNSLGYHPEREAIRVGAWPVQLIPAFDPLTEEAIREAETGDLEGTPIRVVRADFLAVIALSVGRAKDFARILALREAGSVDDEQIFVLADHHGLADAWQKFLVRFDEA
ncbi:MAG: hypothetical protein K8R59_07610 [Thermoanaerobaculales bacterium]|nr:hypothetical protein [Thermoanaerobaculales bacterium]